MKLIYVSTDELNRSLVRSWAGRAGIAVEFPSPQDRAPGGPRDALLIDTDHLPPGWLEGLTARLEAEGGTPPLAAHGYGPSGDELRGRGVEVHPRLRAGVLRDFARAALSSDTAPGTRPTRSPGSTSREPAGCGTTPASRRNPYLSRRSPWSMGLYPSAGRPDRPDERP
jgi:hypothetical protein